MTVFPVPVGAATSNYLVIGVLFVLVFIALMVQRVAKDRALFASSAHLMIAVDQNSFGSLETKIAEYLAGELSGVKLETVSVMEDRVTLRYRYRRPKEFDSAAFASGLQRLAEPAKLETFIG